MTFVQGRSLNEDVLAQVGRLVEGAAGGPVLVILDSDHAEEHVFKMGRGLGGEGLREVGCLAGGSAGG
jgi:cephalosporin hydroxylase